MKLRAFLGRTYQLKAIADYETGPGSSVSPQDALDARKGWLSHYGYLNSDFRGCG